MAAPPSPPAASAPRERPRVACVVAPALALQLLLAREPAWRAHPAAVVASDRPQALVLAACARARAARVRPGMRYAQAVLLEPALRAGVVAAEELCRASAALAARLYRFSPGVEPDGDAAGVCWLDARGLEHLWPSTETWVRAIVDDLEAALALEVGVVAGFTRFGAYALAKLRASARAERRAAPRARGSTSARARGNASERGVPAWAVLSDAADERARLERVPLARLELPDLFAEALERLGVSTLGAFAALPGAGLAERFGAAAYELWQRARGEGPSALLLPRAEPASSARTLDLDDEEASTAGLALRLGPVVDALASEAREANQAIRALALTLRLERGAPIVKRLVAAAPTTVSATWRELLALWLGTLALPAPVVACTLEPERADAPPAERTLFVESSARRRELADGALARLRAELGERAIVTATLGAGHLPEARFAWTPRAARSPRAAAPARGAAEGDAEEDADAPPPCVRRILPRPRVLAHQREEEDGWLAAGIAAGAVTGLYGPFVLAGGWWHREIERSYHYAEVRRGDVLWLYRDRTRARWLEQGRIE